MKSKQVKRLVYIVLSIAIVGGLGWIGFHATMVHAGVPLTAVARPVGPQTFRVPPSAKSAGYVDIKTGQLVTMLREKDFLLIDVHFSFDNELPKTDVLIPFDQIEQNARLLPADKDARIAVYCVSPGMSDIAAKTLVRMGYTNVLNLTDGARDWQTAGL